MLKCNNHTHYQSNSSPLNFSKKLDPLRDKSLFLSLPGSIRVNKNLRPYKGEIFLNSNSSGRHQNGIKKPNPGFSQTLFKKNYKIYFLFFINYPDTLRLNLGFFRNKACSITRNGFYRQKGSNSSLKDLYFYKNANIRQLFFSQSNLKNQTIKSKEKNYLFPSSSKNILLNKKSDFEKSIKKDSKSRIRLMGEDHPPKKVQQLNNIIIKFIQSEKSLKPLYTTAFEVSQTFDDKQALNFYRLFYKNVIWKGKEINKNLLAGLYMNDIILRVWSQLVEFEAKIKKSSSITLPGKALLNSNNIDSNNKYLITNLIKQSQNIPYLAIYVNMHSRFAHLFKSPSLQFVVNQNNQNTILNPNSKTLIYLNKIKSDPHSKMEDLSKMNYNSFVRASRFIRCFYYEEPRNLLSKSKNRIKKKKIINNFNPLLWRLNKKRHNQNGLSWVFKKYWLNTNFYIEYNPSFFDEMALISLKQEKLFLEKKYKHKITTTQIDRTNSITYNYETIFFFKNTLLKKRMFSLNKKLFFVYLCRVENLQKELLVTNSGGNEIKGFLTIKHEKSYPLIKQNQNKPGYMKHSASSSLAPDNRIVRYKRVVSYTKPNFKLNSKPLTNQDQDKDQDLSSIQLSYKIIKRNNLDKQDTQEKDEYRVNLKWSQLNYSLNKRFLNLINILKICCIQNGILTDKDKTKSTLLTLYIYTPYISKFSEKEESLF